MSTSDSEEGIRVEPATTSAVGSGERGELADRALQLAAQQTTICQPIGQPTWLLDRLQAQKTLLRDAYRHFAKISGSEINFSYAAEWLLDNFYVVQQALRQVREDLPQDYYRELPELDATPLAGYPRIYAVAREIIGTCGPHLELDSIQRFVQAYQEVASLKIGELWALPIMLRLGVLECLTQAIIRITPFEWPSDSAPSEGTALREDVTEDDIVANAILSLRMLANQDWKTFFESVSQVEQTLRTDPTGVYAKMDFDTRDRYRKVIEKLALATGRAESTVADAAAGLAQYHSRAGGRSLPRTNHVGYFLVDEGRGLLERHLGFRPPWRVRLRHGLLAHPTGIYLGSIGVLASLMLFLLLSYAQSAGATTLQMLGVGSLVLIPAVTVAVSLANWLVTNSVPPRVLPKMDFRDGIPDNCRTMVVIPAILNGIEEADALLQQLERHFLGNDDSNLTFALLTDYADAPQKHMPSDHELLDRVGVGIRTLNQKYSRETADPFFLFHRERRWNASEGVWMGWERKRGKLEEFNRLLLKEGDISDTVQLGDLEILSQIRYIITLDADTVLPREAARRLIGTLAHPLNQAEFDSQTGDVIAGYTVLQPRVEVIPTSGKQSMFTRVFAGDTGLDLYTRAVSDTYQDLFGEGLYAGKGIYDLAAFERSLAGRIPENTLLSHDLFEGIYGRVGLVTDVITFEEYPHGYLACASRLHRWVRGDWQLLPWLLPGVPKRGGGKQPHDLSVIDHWKIVDNLRRSLTQPALLLLLIAGWLWLPGWEFVWTLVGLLTLAIPLVTSLAMNLAQRLQDETWDKFIQPARTQALRWLLAVIFLPYETVIVLDAIARTLARLAITRRHLLQWTTAAYTNRLFGKEKKAALVWRQMSVAPVIAVLVAGLLAVRNPSSLPVAAPLLLGWLISPQVAFWISQPRRKKQFLPSADQRYQLFRIARRTWFYFEQFVGPDDHWLPPDHFQESPRGSVAHRTSPTNIGLLLLSTLAAYELGYIGLTELAVRLRNTFDTLDGLERHRGHFLNWYETHTLKPLPPRYVSTVDSGNLAGCLLAIRQGCLAQFGAPVLSWKRWQGLLDTLGMFNDIVGVQAKELPEAIEPVQAKLAQIRGQVLAAQERQTEWVPLLVELNDAGRRELHHSVAELITTIGHRLGSATLHRLRTWLERVDHHLARAHGAVEQLAPWLFFLNEPPVLFTQVDLDPQLQDTWQELLAILSPIPQPDQIGSMCQQAQLLLIQLRERLDDTTTGTDERRQEARQWCTQVAEALDKAPQAAGDILAHYTDLSQQAEAFVREMDFGFLFEVQRQVFHIGYHVDVEKLDNSYYDLLASEARIASLVAVATGDVPQRHWLHLGRPLTQVDGMRALLSWSGTMFEYLMPSLLTYQYEDTLLRYSNEAAVARQIAYGREHGMPWGISESGYYRFDANMNYQYQAFGVPGLGLKRGLGEDLVVAPYASLLALPLRPKAVMRNVERLIELEMLGEYGFYEAIDFTGDRLPLGREHARVYSFMAHHQGMILVSLANYLQREAVVRHFHADPLVQSVELLLQERVPHHVPLETPPEGEVPIQVPEPEARAEPWNVPIEALSPQVHVLSNGRYSTLITSAGSGYSQWEGMALTRWRADTTLDSWGIWHYLRDEESSDLWSIGHQPASSDAHREVAYSPHKADFHCHKNGISAHMEVVVAFQDDVEIRRIRLTNHGDDTRRLTLTSYGEVVLAPQETDRRHPAFNKLFVESEYLPELNALLFSRRSRSSDEEPIYLAHALVTEPESPFTGAFESDRENFLGRGRTVRNPVALDVHSHGLSGTTGATLDPIMAFTQEIDIEPYATVQVVYLTAAGRSRQDLMSALEDYRGWSRIERAFSQTQTQSERELRHLEMTTPELQNIQQLLSLLIYPHAALRAEPTTLAANRKGQPGLWPYAISGDYPILLVQVGGEDELGLVRELLRAHNYLRHRNLKIDLVISNQKETGYGQELQGKLRRLCTRMDGDDWLNQRGGIFILRGDQMSEADRVLLEAAARAVFEADKGSLAEQLQGLLERPTPLPALTPTLPLTGEPEPTPSLARPTGLRFDNGLGGFSYDGNEYVIYLEAGKHTPAPWVNVIANSHFGFLASEAGSSYTWAINSGENRLTPWCNDPVADTPGEALYLRDEETVEVWSTTPLPAGESTPYLIRHGTGYSIFEHHSHGLKQRMRVFAVPDAPVKVVQLRLENFWDRARRITATYYVEWVLGTTRDVTQQYIVPEYDAETQALLARNPYNTEFGERIAFLAANRALHGLTADRTEFLGRTGSLSRPDALNRVGLTGRVEAGVDPCAAVQLHIDLASGGTEEVCFLVGQGEDRDKAQELIRKYQDPTQVNAAWEDVIAFWDDLLGTITVETPDPAMDLLLNRWLLYQALVCRVWGRSALYQSSGGFGFRDQLQDVMALVYARPDIAREHILRAARHQFEDGDALHWWHPPSGRGVRTRVSDDLLWLPFVTANYVETTGDTAILTEVVPFRRGEPLDPDENERYSHYAVTGEEFTLYEHCRRALEKGTTAGSHSLPLMGTGDWNDGMNRVGVGGRGESVWLGWFLYAALSRFALLCEQVGDNGQADVYRQQAGNLCEALRSHAWDGRWYLRAFYDDGAPLGSANHDECQIDSIAQSWAVLSGAGDPERKYCAMDAVAERLVRPDDQLLLLFAPPFDKTARDPGYIKGYPPGVRENGGQYTHGALWAVWAFAELGQGDRAAELFRLLNPIYHGDTPEKVTRYRVEPYVVAADVYSVPPHTGRGGWTWYTGSASWMYRLGIEAILGLRRKDSVLQIDPCIPQDWSGFTLTYRFGETSYRIQVANPDGVNRDVKKVTLDDEVLPDGLILLVDDGRRHNVQVWMG